MNRKTIAILALTIAAVAGAVILIVTQWQAARLTNVASLQNAIAPTPAPHVSFVLIKTAKGNRIVVNWSDLPQGTTELNIFLSLAFQKGSPSSTTPLWTLWKTLSLSSGELGNGSRGIDVGTQTFTGSSFYAQAVGNGNPLVTGNNSSSTGGNPPVLWISSSTFPIETTSTPLIVPIAPTSSNPSQPPQPSSTNPIIPPNPTSTSTPTSTGNPAQAPPPNGIPYYTPQGILSGYGFNPTGNFWVQNINQTIEVGWQNLPIGLTSITVLRSVNINGPWIELMKQLNPAPSSTYSLQLVDNGVGVPYYYEMTAASGTITIATYGPIYLTP